MINLNDWGGGWITRWAKHMIPDNALFRAQNIRILPGSMSKRPGTDRVADTSLGANAIRGLYERGTELLCAYQTALYALAAGTFSSVGTITAGSRLQKGVIHQGTGNLYFFDGTLYKTYNGTTCTTQAVTGTSAGSIPTCVSLTNYLGRIWVTGDPTDTDALFPSDADAPTVFNAVYRFRTSTGDKTVACHQWMSFVVLFKERSTHLMVFSDPGDSSTWRQRPLFSTTGCTSGQSIVEDPNGTLYWVSKQGIHRLRPGDAILEQPVATRISENIQPDFDALTTLTDCSAGLEGSYIRFDFPTDGKRFVYRWDMGIWMEDTGPMYSCYLTRSNGNLVAGDDAAGLVFLVDDSVPDDDDGGAGQAAIAYRATTKDYDLSRLLQDKALYEVGVRGAENNTSTTTATVRTLFDGVQRLSESVSFNISWVIGTSTVGTGTVGGVTAPLVALDLAGVGRGKSIQWDILNSVVGEFLTVYGIHLTMRLSRPTAL